MRGENGEMQNPIRNQRQLILQVHCGINGICLLIALICTVALKFSIGLLGLFSILLPIVGIVSFFVNGNIGKGRKTMKDCYVFGSLASILSLYLVSQLLFGFIVTNWIWALLYFIITGAMIVGIGYFIFCGNIQGLSRSLTPITLVAAVVIGLLIAIVIYKYFFCYFFTPGFLLFWSYLFWILDLVLMLFVCLDLRIILFKGR